VSVLIGARELWCVSFVGKKFLLQSLKRRGVLLDFIIASRRLPKSEIFVASSDFFRHDCRFAVCWSLVGQPDIRRRKI